VIGGAVVSASYLSGLALIQSPWQVMVFNVLVSVGVGLAFASLPALINAAVPMSETAAANGINALARALGTSISSAVIGAILAGMSVTVGGAVFPTLNALRIALVVAAGAAALATVMALLIPAREGDATDDGDAVPAGVTARSAP
jgi:MFS family permease